MPRIEHGDRIAIAKWVRLRGEAEDIVKGEAAERARLKREIAIRETTIVTLKETLEKLPVTIVLAKQRISTCNLQLEGLRHKQKKSVTKARLRRQKNKVKEELRQLREQLQQERLDERT